MSLVQHQGKLRPIYARLRNHADKPGIGSSAKRSPISRTWVTLRGNRKYFGALAIWSGSFATVLMVTYTDRFHQEGLVASLPLALIGAVLVFLAGVSGFKVGWGVDEGPNRGVVNSAGAWPLGNASDGNANLTNTPVPDGNPQDLSSTHQRVISATEDLRRHIAQELHGTVQNKLIVLQHRLGALEQITQETNLVEELVDLRESIGVIVDEDLRQISHQLYPAILRMGLIPALLSLLDHAEPALKIDVVLDEELVKLEKADRNLIPESMKLMAYRIVEEALTNIIKHSNASHALICVDREAAGSLGLTVKDNGVGFDQHGATRGIGTDMLEAYSRSVGGVWEIISTPGEGTLVKALLPLPMLGQAA